MEIMTRIPGRNCAWNDDSIERYSMCTLSEDEAARFEEHLLVCEVCQARLADQDAFGYAMRMAALELRRQPPAVARRARLFPRMAPVLAFAALVLLLAVAGWRWMRPSGAATAVAVQLEALRGAQPGSRAPAGHPLALNADLAGLPAAGSYPLELVDRDGRSLWKGSTASPTAPGLRPGLYFLRVYSNGGELLREYGLEVVK